MKKFILLPIFLFGLLFSAKAQNSITLSWNGITFGDTLIISGAPADTNDQSEFVFNAIIHNNTSNGMNIRVARTNIEIEQGTNNSFCWPAASCWSPTIDTSITYGFVPAGGQSKDEEFSGHYSYNDTLGNHVYGTSVVKYSFFNKDNTDIKTDVIVKYQLGYLGVEENLFGGSEFSNIFPNPATSFVKLNYQFGTGIISGNIKIINLLGKVMKEIPLDKTSNQVKINVSDLNSGIYFYSIWLNNREYKTKKLIIKK